MRKEQEMMELVLGIAQSDERIRAVYLNGSRANPSINGDKYQDYDIVYIVTEISSFIEDKKFPQNFGTPLIIQEPHSPRPDTHHAWLMLFQDGVRIDLQIENKEKNSFGEDTLTIPLLDKDNILKEISLSNDKGYWIKKPTEAEYAASCNEFWWCLNNVAKGIKRQQLSYTMRMYMETVHLELETMLDWFIAVQHNFELTTGMWGKHIKSYLPDELYESYKKTYLSAEDEKNSWQAIFTACDLFHLLANDVGKRLNFTYAQSDEDGMRAYLNMIKNNE
ncbi:aminoglycoside 6-adenylyltransferase [Lactococcus allomyrinae]|uniref:Aminoglycoside 6-adenylyltransferase n=1 Tax=Lactococcus allomyrinae TaxID=2419773 RepID=A0A387BIA6_9LACT|nr:aminoglycoside 6-adenylyltransferase [Lactococcus allomyrinae]AYG00757.1 aminoglycoside 6-adenylyltransferase [Lactococcus allomyrinae]